MKINNIIPQQYNRLFTFGCSMTQYLWPTWADIIGVDIPIHENWGKAGAGNHFIFNSIMECDAKNKFSDKDLILIMWSGPEREDRYINNKWIVAGASDKEKIYGKKWVKEFGSDSRGCLIRDLAYIKSIQEFLEYKNVAWANFSMYAICSIDENKIIKDGYSYKNDLDTFVQRYVQLNRNLCDGKKITEPYVCDADVLNQYQDVYANIEYSILDTIRDGYFLGNNRANFGDGHCTPIENLQYLDYLYPNNTLSKEARQFVVYWEGIVQSIKKKDTMPVIYNRPEIVRL